MCSRLGLDQIRLLKVEAEGAEPEVLLGAVPVFAQIDYITVACGPERGPDRTCTDEECASILKEHGFVEVISTAKPRNLLFARADIV